MLDEKTINSLGKDLWLIIEVNYEKISYFFNIPFFSLFLTNICLFRNYKRGWTEKKTYEKVDDYMYLKTLNTGENQNFKIVNETESFVVLVQSFTFPGLFVTIIDKTNNTFVEDFITLDKDLDSRGGSLFGECVKIKN